MQEYRYPDLELISQSGRGKSSTGWRYGFTGQLVVNEQGDILL
ncbi:transposase [Candidatus Methylobacter favarea]